MHFTVVIPTIRQHLPLFEQAMADIRASFTQPTDLHVIDGKGGKAATLNRAYDDVLAGCREGAYVTLDDDFVPAKGWQDALASAFEALPKVGVFSIWPGDTEEMLNYVGRESVRPWQEDGGVKYRLLKQNRHIPGFLLAFRPEVARAIGKQPESGLRYEIWEDAWRGRRAWKLGWASAYIAFEPPVLVRYVDDKEYVTAKFEDIERGRAIQEGVMRKDGVGDPLSWRLRRFVARLRGRG